MSISSYTEIPEGETEILEENAIDYIYDADGILVGSIVDGETTNYLVGKNRDYAQSLKYLLVQETSRSI